MRWSCPGHSDSDLDSQWIKLDYDYYHTHGITETSWRELCRLIYIICASLSDLLRLGWAGHLFVFSRCVRAPFILNYINTTLDIEMLAGMFLLFIAVEALTGGPIDWHAIDLAIAQSGDLYVERKDWNRASLKHTHKSVESDVTFIITHALARLYDKLSCISAMSRHRHPSKSALESTFPLMSSQPITMSP